MSPPRDDVGAIASQVMSPGLHLDLLKEGIAVLANPVGPPQDGQARLRNGVG